jgi:CheY-like chemotaxis protein
VETADWKVIVVEDTYDDIQLISKILCHHGVEVHVTKNGNECIRLLKELSPTLIVTDLAMAEKDGWQTLAAIRSDVNTAHIPVVAVTAYHSVDVAEDVFRAGFNGYFPKPVDPVTFVQRLQAIVNLG